MRNLVITTLSILILTACSPSKNELYKITDSFVKSLDTEYESYGILGNEDDSKTTSDGLYKVSPIGRMINVRIEKVVNEKEYNALKDDLKSHYKNDKRVQDVYINNGGTIIIDCRN
jgi:hypothetical protein